ncbi:SDR family NAD(P)-dependent oxidoreductase [Falsigemmobacter faecalis]|uniref:SDR family NAD(P)-dependent oxidoreductase n=1 Tax=Falsigemmobacter faecalis TaxID=2488730 RepID=A0A3P3D5V2_9RHOB|nr:SDR family NAD(P)-dependent oxidoreductase [Falsigemmobacter faecalis]RRH69767.1 SDR family NAD(P)-dependent oxidoreductase [Falsigemmobacter faecalis]
MTAEISFAGQVAIVTGAGSGLGRAHALALARRGVRVAVNDLAPAEGGAETVALISAEGGEALLCPADVSDGAQVGAMVQAVLDHWGRIDILVNNAGFLRDKSFAKLEMADFDRVVNVHLTGSAHCCKAVWPVMQAQGYGRIVMTSSASGLFGNFGQANYAAAKAGVIGLMKVLSIEGRKHNIFVNALAPTAMTAMTDGLVEAAAAERLDPAAVSPGVLFLTSPEAPNGVILGAGAGAFSLVRILETAGHWLPPEARTPEGIRDHFDRISDPAGLSDPGGAFEQTAKFIRLAEAGLAEETPS